MITVIIPKSVNAVVEAKAKTKACTFESKARPRPRPKGKGKEGPYSEGA